MPAPTITFEAVRVPAEHLIGPVGRAELILLHTLDFMRFGGVPVILGLVVGGLRDIMPWLEERVVAQGEPLIRKNDIQMLLGRFYAEVQCIRLLLWRAAALIDQGRPCGPETAIANYRASRLAVEATQAFVRLWGWRGLDAGYPAEKRLRDAMATTIFEGANEILELHALRDFRRQVHAGGDLQLSRIVPISKNRLFIIDLLARARRFHCPVTTDWWFDVTALNKARLAVRVNGRKLGMTARLIKATSLVLRAHPRFDHHLFTGLFGRYEVAFDSVCCTLIVMRRGRHGERILLPLLIEDSDRLAVTEIQELIDQHRYAKLETLPQFQAIERLKKLPRVALSWFSFKCRSDHRFYRRYFGTYGVSPMAVGAFGPRSGHVVANTAAAFAIGPLPDVPAQAAGGRPSVRQQQGITLIVDHYVLDAIDMLEGMRTLEKLLADPGRLGLAPVADRAAAE